MTGVIEDYIRLRVDQANDTERTRGAEEVIEAVQAYEPWGFGRRCNGL